MRILFIGGGNMAAALVGGLLARGTAADELAAVDPSDAQRAALGQRFGIATCWP
jgi:pyrroline-5-carboxylate reductase